MGERRTRAGGVKGASVLDGSMIKEVLMGRSKWGGQVREAGGGLPDRARP